MSRSAADDARKFEYPHNPKLEDCDLNLIQKYAVNAQGGGHHEFDDLGLQAGFGKQTDEAKRETWGRDVHVETMGPHWVPEMGEKGRWCEEVTFSTTITFRCSPPFVTQLLSNTVGTLFVIENVGSR